MGTYVYRVTSRKVKCADGEDANVAVFAYKPYSETMFSSRWKAENSKMHFRSGCSASDKRAKEGKLTGRVVLGGKDEMIPAGSAVYRWRWGSFRDDGLGMSPMPHVTNTI